MRAVLEQCENGIERLGLGRLYVVLALFFGSLMLLVTPPYQVPDEPMHIFRAWQVSEGIWMSPVAKEAPLLDWTFSDSFTVVVPKSFLQTELTGIPAQGYSLSKAVSFMRLPLQPEEKAGVLAVPNTGAYAPLAYAPQAFAAFCGRTLNMPAGMLFCFMRFSGLLFVIFCVYMSLRLLPEKQLLIWGISFMPMFLFQASSSADAVVQGVCLLGVAWLLSLRRAGGKLTMRTCVLLLLLAVCLGLLKQVYGVLLLLYFLLPVRCMGSRQRFWEFGVLLLAVSLGSSALWLQAAVAAQGARLSYMAGTDMAAQLAGIQAAPWAYLQLFLNNVQLHAREWSIMFIGQLGWLSVALPVWFLSGYALLLALGAFCGSLGLRLWQRVVLLAVFVIAAAATITSLYLTWTQVGAPIIDGVQGRYFIPVALPFFAALSCCARLRYEGMAALLGALVSGVVSVQALYAFYYLG